MGKRAFDRIAEGLHEAIAIARAEARPARLHIPAEIDARAVRAKLALSQADFAALFGFAANRIKDWEQGRSRPLGGVCAFLTIIARDPALVLQLLRAASGKKTEAA
jgi:putative transcriptional regulator